MKKIILSLVAGLGLAASGHAAVLGSYNFTSGAGPSSSVPTLTFSDVTRVTVTAATGTGVFASSGWSKNNTIDTAQYVQFTFVTSGQASSGFTLSSITFNHQNVFGSNGKSGPTSGEIRVFIGAANPAAGATPTASSTFSPQTTTSAGSLTFGSPVNVGQNQVVTVRFYGWGADPSGTGMLNFDDIQVDGVAPVPEPINVALALFGLTFVGIGVGRKMLKKKA